MKFTPWLTALLGALLLSTFVLPSPSWTAEKSKAPKIQKVKKTSISKKDSAHSSRMASAKGAKKASLRVELKGDAKVAKASQESSAERDLWLKRAQASDALTGKASWYGKDFHNKPTASGLAYDMHTFTAAHRTLPLGTVVKVTDQHNGKSVMVCVTDRGPYVPGRIIDVSAAAATKLDLKERGVGKVRLEVVSDENGAPLRKDTAYYVRYASGAGKSMVGPFKGFADAAAMHEALRQAHPDAEVVLGDKGK